MTTAAVARLKQEADEYQALIAAPADMIGGRATLTQAVRPRFRETEAKFQELDDLAHQFETTPGGRHFVDCYFQARKIKDLGHGPTANPPPSPPAAPPS